MVRIELERLAEHPERLLAITKRLANRSEAAVDPDVILTVMVDQDLVIELSGVIVRGLEVGQ